MADAAPARRGLVQLRYMHEHHARPDVCVCARPQQTAAHGKHALCRVASVSLARSAGRRGWAKPTATASLASLSFRTSATDTVRRCPPRPCEESPNAWPSLEDLAGWRHHRVSCLSSACDGPARQPSQQQRPQRVDSGASESGTLTITSCVSLSLSLSLSLLG